MDNEWQPEEVLREFFIVNLRPDEVSIRKLILDHPDAELLWQGNYPEDVATTLERQYRQMQIERVREGPERVLLRSSAMPIPVAVVKVHGGWRVDAGPIIEFRKRAIEIRNRGHDQP